MKTPGWNLVVLLLSFVGVSTTSADLLFSHQPPRLESGAAVYSNLGDISPPQQIAGDFLLSSPAVITNAFWWGIYYPKGLPANLDRVQFTLRFFVDGGQKPSALVGQARVQATVVVSSVLPDVVLYKFSGALTPPMLVSNGVTYWVSILDSDPATTEGFRWSEADLFEPLARATRENETSPWFQTLNAWPQAYVLEGTSPGSHRPVAVAKLFSASLLSSNADQYVVLAPDDRRTHVTLDGSFSIDPDSDALQYSWFEAGTSLRPIGNTAIITTRFRPGTYLIQLRVSDASAFGLDTINLKVLTRAQAIGELIRMVAQSDLREKDKRPLITTLMVAAASFNRHPDRAGINHLRTFKNKVRAQITRTNPVLADRLIRSADTLIRAIGVGETKDAGPRSVSVERQ